MDNAPPGVREAVLDEILTRTPGFTGWQQEEWLFHCDDGAAFLGPAGRPELEPYPDARESLRREHAGIGWSDEQIEEYIDSLRTGDAMPTAYLFRCLHCGEHLAYSDFT